jgi:hypothetical protein
MVITDCSLVGEKMNPTPEKISKLKIKFSSRRLDL